MSKLLCAHPALSTIGLLAIGVILGVTTLLLWCVREERKEQERISTRFDNA